MAPRDQLEGIRLKLRRGRDGLRALRSDFDAFVDSRPYLPQIRFDQKTSRLSVTLHADKRPDPMWGVRVGEVVHNFRSALDHVVWELAACPKGPGQKCQFPIFNDEARFRARVGQFLKGVSPQGIDLIRAEQPFSVEANGTVEGTRSPLWHLKVLNDIDKHRTIHVTMAILSEFQFDFPQVMIPFTARDVVKHQHGAVEDGAVLFAATLEGATEFPFGHNRTTAKLGIEVAFEQNTPSAGPWSVHGTLAEIGDRTEKVLRTITGQLFKSEL